MNASKYRNQGKAYTKKKPKPPPPAPVGARIPKPREPKD